MIGGWRLATVGLLFAAMFTVLGLRLWSVQVTAAQAYEEQAEHNQVRIVSTPAPRGSVYDSNGTLLATTRPSLAAVVDMALVDDEVLPALAQALAALTGVPASELLEDLTSADGGAQLIVGEDLSEAQSLVLAEHREEFPGVAVIPQPLRHYPLGDVAAQVLGYIGQPSEADLERTGVKPNDIVGKAGIERFYDDRLRGTEGLIKYQVDARRNVLARTGEQDPAPGSSLVLTIDADVQTQLEASLAEGLAVARRAQMKGRRDALAEKDADTRIAEAEADAREALLREAAAAGGDGGDGEADTVEAGPDELEVEVDVGAVLGPLFGGLPLDAQGVCLPVERVELVEGRFRRLSELDARRIRLEGVVERRSELYALITVEGETFEVRDGQRFATSLRLIDSQLALEIVHEETGRISGAEPATVVLHHEDRWCPVRSVGVVLDPRDGSVLAMASAPTFDPNSFVRGLPVDEWQELLTVNAFTNFAIQGVYAPASTMKSVAYMLAMEEGVYPLDRPAGDRTVGSAEEERPLVPLESDTDEYECRGSLRFEFNDGTEQVYSDWKRTGHGPLDLHGALEASCDLYFWEIALRIWNERDEDGGIHNENLWQEWARSFGFDAATGIDLPFEKEGLIPDRRWYREEQRAGSPRVRSDGPWVGGDLMNAVIGEGSVLATPLQLANAYAAMANGGTLWTPRVLDRVVDQDGRVLDDNPPRALARIPLDVDTVQAFRRDLQSVINGSRGTARDTFSRFGENVEIVGGKTGTGEVIKATEDAFDVDNAWFVGLAPISAPRYVVAVVVERGGSGGGIAAPVARQVLQFLINGPDGVTPIEKAARAD